MNRNTTASPPAASASRPATLGFGTATLIASPSTTGSSPARAISPSSRVRRLWTAGCIAPPGAGALAPTSLIA